MSHDPDRHGPEDGEDAEPAGTGPSRRLLLVVGAGALVVALIAIGTLLGGSLRDVPWLAVAAVLVLLAAIWRVERRRP